VSSRVRLGYACNWEPRRHATWSYTAWNLRRALGDETDIVDVGVDIAAPVRGALKVMHIRRGPGRWVSTWRYSSLTDAICARAIQQNTARHRCDAVLEIQDLAATNVPFFVVQDLTFDILLRIHDDLGGSVPHFPGLTRDAMRRRRDRQLRIYEQASGVLVLSKWVAAKLVEWSDLPRSKVHVIYPGRTVPAPGIPPARHKRPQRRRLLLVGRDFHAKGGDIVLGALRILRDSYHRDTTLTVAGPSVWPLPGAIPDGVRFVGRVPVNAVADLYHSHDLMVMPSRLEGFGIVFVEALANGLPCVGRAAFAMPEVIVPGQNGALTKSDDQAELAEAVAGVLQDDALYKTCAEQAREVADRFTWGRAASQVADVIRSTLG